MASATMLLTVVRERWLRSAPLRFCRLSRVVSVNASACVILFSSPVARSSKAEVWDESVSDIEDDSDLGSGGVDTPEKCEGRGEGDGTAIQGSV